MAGPIDAATFVNLVEMTGGDLAFVDELVDTYLEEGDRLVEDLIVAAMHDAHRKVDETLAEQLKGITGGMGLPGF